MRTRIFLLLVLCCFIRTTHPGSAALTPEDQTATDQAINDFKQMHKQVQSAAGINDKLFTPTTNSNVLMQTFDQTKSFDASVLCQKKELIVQTSVAPAANGEVNVSIQYDPLASGNLSGSLTIANVSAACNGGAIYDCQNGWENCKFGVLEQSGGIWQINPNFPSGIPRSAEGMKGCFCFSNYCGGSSNIYIEQIQSFIAQPIANYIAQTATNMIQVSSEYDTESQTTAWYAGNTEDCTLQSVTDLTAQSNKMTLDYQSVLNAAENDPESPWSLIASSAGNSYSDATCEINNKVSSDWAIVERTMPTDLWIGWDLDGDTKDCFYVNPGKSCGANFGETGSFSTCQSWGILPSRMISACNSYYVNSGQFISITNIQNVKLGATTDMMTLGVQCFGAGDTNGQWTHVDPAIALHMDCIGKRYDDHFVCDSVNKSQPGTVLYNSSPYSPALYDGCDEVHPSEDGCTTFEQNSNCTLTTEITDGALTISSSTLTGATVPPTCKIIKGTLSSITVCEPWWKKVRTYTCSDKTLDLTQAKQRVDYIGSSLTISDDKFLSQMGDLVFDGSDQGVVATYMTGIQFQGTKDICTPSCIVQRTVPNYSIVLPEKQAGTQANPDSPEEANVPSMVPSGNQVIINSFECTFEDNAYTCPVPDGWTMRSQCSCGDGKEFANAITTLSLANEIVKDIVCSSGQDVGICDTPSSDVSYPVVCGNLPAMAAGGSGSGSQDGEANDYSGTLVEGTDFWQCAPVFWTGKTASPQTHTVYLDPKTQTCIGIAKASAETETEARIATNQVYVRRSWFAPVLEWAKEKITEHFQETDGYWLTSDGCDCGMLPDNEIPICKPGEDPDNPDATVVNCLNGGARYETLEECRQECKGRATEFNDKVCVWNNVIENGQLPLTWQLGNNPQKEEVFGAVYINATSETSIKPVDCTDESEEVEVIEAGSGTCDLIESETQWEGPSVGIGLIQQDNSTNYRWQECSIHPVDYDCHGLNTTDCYQILNLNNFDSIKNLIKDPYVWHDYFAGCGGHDYYPAINLFRDKNNYFNNNPRDVHLNVCQTGANDILNMFLNNSCNYAISSGIMSTVTEKKFTIYQTINPGTSSIYPGNCYGFENRYTRNFQSICVGKTSEYVCSTNNDSFKTLAECANVCSSPTQYRCKQSGRMVSDPMQCSQYRCPATDKTYTTNAECGRQCTISSTTQTHNAPPESVNCVDMTEQVKTEQKTGTCTNQSWYTDKFVGPWVDVGSYSTSYSDNESGLSHTTNTCNISPQNMVCTNFPAGFVPPTNFDQSLKPGAGYNGLQPPNICGEDYITLLGWNSFGSYMTGGCEYPYGAAICSGPIGGYNGYSNDYLDLANCEGDTVWNLTNGRCTYFGGCVDPITPFIKAVNDKYCAFLQQSGISDSNATLNDQELQIAFGDNAAAVKSLLQAGGNPVAAGTKSTSQYNYNGSDGTYDQYFALTCPIVKVQYHCDLDDQMYSSEGACQTACAPKPQYTCQPSGRVVADPLQCSQFQCPITNLTYSTNAECARQCALNAPPDSDYCASNASQVGFVTYLTETELNSGIYNMVLKEILPGSTNVAERIDIATAPYNNEQKIAQQCVSQYSQPYLKFDEPGTNAHFEFSFMDANVYLIAAIRGELPMNTANQQLPAKPPVYLGSAGRAYQVQLMRLSEGQVDINNVVTMVPNSQLTTEQKETIIGTGPDYPLTTHGEYIQDSADMMRFVPRKPMFISKSMTDSAYDPESRKISFTAGNLVSSVYYYGCPQGTVTDTDSCKALAPIGGMADTIQGPRCFQYFCDDQAIMETDAGQNSGCGLTNDGTYSSPTNPQ